MASFLALPTEVHLLIISNLDLRNGLLSLQTVNKYFYDIFKDYPQSICRSIAIQRPTYDFINLMRSNLGEIQSSYIQFILESGLTDWTDITFQRDVCKPLSSDLSSFGINELKALQRFEDMMVTPYVECIRNRCLPNYVLSSAELNRVEQAIVNCYLLVKHIHAVKLAVPKLFPSLIGVEYPLLKDESNEIVIQDDFAIGPDGEEIKTDNIGVLDIKGLMEEYSVEEHMHMVSVFELLSYRGMERRGSYTWEAIKKLPGISFAERFKKVDFDLADYLGWALYDRLVDIWLMSEAELEPKNWRTRYGPLGDLVQKRMNTIIRNSVYDFGQADLVEFIMDKIPKYGFTERTLQKVSFGGSGRQLEMLPFTEFELRWITGQIWIGPMRDDLSVRLEERALLIPDIKKYGGKWERVMESKGFGGGVSFKICKRQ